MDAKKVRRECSMRLSGDGSVSVAVLRVEDCGCRVLSSTSESARTRCVTSSGMSVVFAAMAGFSRSERAASGSHYTQYQTSQDEPSSYTAAPASPFPPSITSIHPA